jgi:aspartate racemase
MSTFYFCELITAHTKAACDADHIDMLISSRASTPDRTAFILGKSENNPLPVIQEEAKRLTQGGADLLVIPCNTAHYFYEGLQSTCSVPILNIIEETVNQLERMGVSRFGLLATEGTVEAGAYQRVADPLGVRCNVPTADEQAVITDMIYGSIKQNKPVDQKAFLKVANALLSRGCETLVLGCTELSLLKKSLPDNERFVDSLEVLAHRTILLCGKTPVGFGKGFAECAEVTP